MGERFADDNVVNRVPQGCGGVMVWAGISYNTFEYTEIR
jgi:hypothetical protein